MLGWPFGLTECASVVLVVGFSVDYCVCCNAFISVSI